MGYSGRKRNYPNEYASKSSHRNIIKDETIQEYLKNCELPKKTGDVEFDVTDTIEMCELDSNPIDHVIAIDAGMQEIFVQEDFPSAQICFFQFGVLKLSMADLRELTNKKFIDPKDLSKIKIINPLKLVIPTRNIKLYSENNLTESVRRSIFDFFLQDIEGLNMADTLKWLIFTEYGDGSYNDYSVRCPSCGILTDQFNPTDMGHSYYSQCPNCREKIYITDIFGIDHYIDNEIGAQGSLSYLTSLIEQMLMIHYIRIVLDLDPTILSKTLFVRDGPLAFFGLTSILTGPMRRLINFLFDTHDLNMVGLEKSGLFVDHADQISSKMHNGTAIILNDEHIYKYIIPNKFQLQYGRGQHYSNKIILKTGTGKMYVASLPTRKFTTDPCKDDFENIEIILFNINELKCDMFENAVLPIALINKLVSMSDHPSSSILGRFAKTNIIR